jgi:hypothetical protein
MAQSLGKLVGEASRELQRRSRADSDSKRAPSKGTRSTEQKLRLAMLTQLFAMLPAGGDERTIEIRLLGYVAELGDIHADVLAAALRRLVRDPKRGNFLPLVHEIRRSAALVVRHARAGRDAMTSERDDPSATEPNVERLLQLGPRPGEPCPYPQLASGAQLQLTAGG